MQCVVISTLCTIRDNVCVIMHTLIREAAFIISTLYTLDSVIVVRRDDVCAECITSMHDAALKLHAVLVYCYGKDLSF